MTVDFDGELLIPNGNIGDFAVVACDQFTSDPDYWMELARTMPKDSALGLILPECFLSDAQALLPEISKNAKAMTEGGRFRAVHGAVYVTRATKYGRVRHGVVATVDLADYEYAPGNRALIRASERTVEERIPPRVAIRNNIDIELPHIMLLVDDKADLVMSACRAASRTPLYDGELSGGGGRLTGELITDTAPLYAAVERIIAQSASVYGSPLFALVGDGNHSLATAKRCAADHPTPLSGRAAVEIVNIYDEGLVFEPIHRIVRTDDPRGFAAGLSEHIAGEGRMNVYLPEPVTVPAPMDKVEAIKAVDKYCESYVAGHGGYVDYVHGSDALKKPGFVGLEMSGLKKEELFPYVVKNGVLPKKTFSLGEAEEKRYYAEARRIK